MSFLLILLTLWGATSSPTASIAQLEKFTTYVETNYEDWSNAEWDKASQSYSLIKKDLKNYQFTDEQLQKIGRYQGRCTVVFSKHKVENAGETLKKTVTKIGGFFEGIGEGLEK